LLFVACQQDQSHEPPHAPLPDAVAPWEVAFFVVRAIADGLPGSFVTSRGRLEALGCQDPARLLEQRGVAVDGEVASVEGAVARGRQEGQHTRRVPAIGLEIDDAVPARIVGARVLEQIIKLLGGHARAA
jgi:hypothetical protein